MSAQQVEHPASDVDQSGSAPGPASAVGPVEVRRSAAVTAVIGAAASAIAIAYLWRAVGSGAVLDWLLCAVLSALAVMFLRGLLDARTPLLVADELGVRVRLGQQWRGLPWEAIDSIAVKPRRGLLHDGKLVVEVQHAQRAVEGLDSSARRDLALNRKLYGAELAVPLGLTTRITGTDVTGLADRVSALSSGRAEVVTLVDGSPVAGDPASIDQGEGPVHGHTEPVASQQVPAARRRLGEVTSAVSSRTAAVSSRVSGAVSAAVAPVAPPAGAPAGAPAGNAGPRGSRVRAIAELGEPVAPLVIEEYQPEPAYDPVIGPELAAARTRVGLSVDELAERTRIRPHVIESLEVDDFSACGGDFYARGHIRTLARVLGKDPAPMLAHFEQRYATAPVTARRVFEAELATGMTGSMRKTVGGPSWALLVGTVLALVLVWSLVRLLGGSAEPVLEDAPPMLPGSLALGTSPGQSGGQSDGQSAGVRTVTTVLTADHGGAQVVVRDGGGAVVYRGDLVLGEVQRVRAEPPVTVTTDDGGALSVVVDGRDRGLLGKASEPANRTFRRPAG